MIKKTTRLSTVRIIRGMNQKEFAEKMNVPLDTLKNWECRRNRPSPKGALRIRTFLKRIDVPETIINDVIKDLIDGGGGDK